MAATRSSHSPGGRRRVVVTGLGVVTPIGFDLDSFWKAALAGTSGVRRISHFDPEGLPTQIAASLADPALIEEFRAEAELNASEPRGTVVGARAAHGAVAAAGARETLASPRAGVIVGTSGERHDLRELGASAAPAGRPFDSRRDGFVMGESAGFLVREEAEHARQRGGQLLAEVAGYGTTCDAYRITDGAPDGRGAIRAIRAALGDASLGPEDLDYVNAHGTYTPMNDR